MLTVSSGVYYTEVNKFLSSTKFAMKPRRNLARSFTSASVHKLFLFDRNFVCRMAFLQSVTVLHDFIDRVKSASRNLRKGII